MIDHFQIRGIRVPAYGLIVIAGICLCNCIAQSIIKRENLRINVFLVLEVNGGLGALVGAKLLSIVSALMRGKNISPSWDAFDKAGYSYYGGLAGFFLIAFIIERIGKCDMSEYAAKMIFLIPLLHTVWKIGCFCGGCCFGIPYDGRFRVTFPEGVNELSGVAVFPVQLLEAGIALIIAATLFLLGNNNLLKYPVEIYLFLYGITRFAAEFMRYHASGRLWGEGHAYSLICIATAVVIVYNQKIKEVNNYE